MSTCAFEVGGRELLKLNAASLARYYDYGPLFCFTNCFYICFAFVYVFLMRDKLDLLFYCRRPKKLPFYVMLAEAISGDMIIFYCIMAAAVASYWLVVIIYFPYGMLLLTN